MSEKRLDLETRGNKIKTFGGRRKNKGKVRADNGQELRSRKVTVHSSWTVKQSRGVGTGQGCGTETATEDVGYVWAMYEGLCGDHLLGQGSCRSNLVKRKLLLRSSGTLAVERGKQRI